MNKPIRIHQLDQIIADQIAAGEVVERPASVVKEIVENSLDSGATHIEIAVEKAGSRLISIKDNGHGIHPDDLALALKRHATSKIFKTQDLASINTLGFRGEALASIASVSQLTLTSRLKDADYAFQAIAEGPNRQVEVTPAALGFGTQVDIRDLFFNTPARRRFLRAEKTEFHHIEMMVNRFALSHPQIQIQLKNNGKWVKQFQIAHDREGQEKRIAQIMGKEFIAHAVHFSLEFEGMKLSGWLGLPSYHRSQNDGQYFFVNKRHIQDRVISHAIREAYGDQLPQGRICSYLLFFELSPHDLDVNVHPTKHEVRFHQSRMVHDFLVRAIHQVLREGQQLNEQEQPIELVPSQTATVQWDQKNTFTQQSKSSSHLSYSDYSHGATQPIPLKNIKEHQKAYGLLLATSSKNASTHKPVFYEETKIQPEKTAIVKPLSHSQQPEKIWVLHNSHLLFQEKTTFYILSIRHYFLSYHVPKWQKDFKENNISSKKILFPTSYQISGLEYKQFEAQQTRLATLGFVYRLESAQSQRALKFLSIPAFLEGIPLTMVIESLYHSINQRHEEMKLIELMKTFIKNICEHSSAIPTYIEFFQLQKQPQLLSWIEKNDLMPSPCIKPLSPENLIYLFQDIPVVE